MHMKILQYLVIQTVTEEHQNKFYSHLNSGKQSSLLHSVLMVPVSHDVEALYSVIEVLKDRFYTCDDLYPKCNTTNHVYYHMSNLFLVTLILWWCTPQLQTQLAVLCRKKMSKLLQHYLHIILIYETALTTGLQISFS
jgi:hypothetical protein